MNRSTEKFQRWIELITFLAGRRYPVGWEEIAVGVSAYARRWASGDETDRESVRRMFERDKRDLRELGIPLERAHSDDTPRATRGAGEGSPAPGPAPPPLSEGYLLRDRDFFLPYLHLVEQAVLPDPSHEPPEPSPEGAPVKERERALRERLAQRAPRPPSRPGTVALTPEEGAVALEALRLVEGVPGFPLAADARSARAKLRAELGVPAPDSPLLFVERPGAERVRERVERIAGAILDRRVLRFRYRGMASEEITERRVHPLGLLLQWGYWYLVTWDRDREGMRQFRVGRMEEVRLAHPGASGPEFEVPGDFRLDRWLRRPPWALDPEEGGGTTVRVRFPHPLSLWAERNGHGRRWEGTDDGREGGHDADPGGGGAFELREFHVRDRGPFLRWLLALGGAARVVDPPALAAELEEMARGVLRAHEEQEAQEGEESHG